MVKDGQHTANEEIKKATQTVYEASFKKFSDFCSTNGYPEPRHERHYDLPVVLVAYSQSISASSSISLQTAEKARSAVTSYYSPHQNSGGTDVNTWSVREDESGEKRGYGNFTRAVCVSIHAWAQEQESIRGLRDSAKKVACGSRLFHLSHFMACVASMKF
ncbi:hypothetical protein L915_09470 [Phytophthora nicotianae]|uniref:Uncharacterized protein n=1 Tax=Phytophthora nicotianae TaxID=4792 RepID=W2GSH9_PHYNI|nr:hypothetical protein L915_09470 [Phytophthora nicotianae]